MLDRTRLFTTAPLDAQRSLRLGQNIYQSEASLDRLSFVRNRTKSAERRAASYVRRGQAVHYGVA